MKTFGVVLNRKPATTLVFGGSSFVGKNLQKVRPEWTYLSSHDCNLLNLADILEYLEEYTANCDDITIINLAGKVGGIAANAESQFDFFSENVLINTNLLYAASKFQEVRRVLSSLSTCAWPDVVDSYPFSEADMMKGDPAATNFGYGYAKRMLQLQSMMAGEQFLERRINTFAPSNLYGPHDHFDESGHFVAALCRKIFEANNGDTLHFMGDGQALRQQLFVEDLCQIIPRLVGTHRDNEPLIVAPDEELTIEQMIQIGIEVSGKRLNYEFDGSLPGQFRKTGSNALLKKLVSDVQFTSFRDGFQKTLTWYRQQRVVMTVPFDFWTQQGIRMETDRFPKFFPTRVSS